MFIVLGLLFVSCNNSTKTELDVIDSKGNKMGMAKKNGSYYNIKGENLLNIGKTEGEKCEILDAKGHNVGSVHKNYKLHACAAHCLMLAQKNNKKAKN